MCKKSLLMMLLLALLAPWAANAQTRETLTFDFEDQTIPATWTNDATYPWIVVSESQGSGHNGTYCIRSGNKGVNSSSSSISATFNFWEDGTISFLGGCWGEGSSYDVCKFFIDGTQKFSHGNKDTWETYSYNVTAGRHTFTWTFTKDSSVAGTGDAFFVDDIVVNLGEEPDCLPPTNVAATDPTSHGATISWTGTSDSYIVMVAEEIVQTDCDFETGQIPADFTNSTTYPWTVTAGGANSSSYCAIPGNTGISSSDSDLTLQVTGPCTVSFMAKVSSESGWDKGSFRIDGTEKFNISGTQDWTAYSYELAEGTHTLVWRYHKDSSGNTGNDLFYVDNIYVSSLSAWDESHTASASPYTFTDLNPGATYQVMVKGVCGNEQSFPSDVVSFTTLETCPTPTNLTVSNVGAHTATLNWDENGTATMWRVYRSDVSSGYYYAEENPTYTFNNLQPETTYTVKVAAACGGGEFSGWSNEVSFTTEPSCYAPTDMVISDITASSANIAWTSENTNFELRYSPDVRPITTFDDSQMHGWTNIDADGDGYEWVLATEAAGVYHNTGVDLTGEGHNGSNDFIVSGSFTNAVPEALTPDNYLVSPQITLGGSITFWAQAQDADYPEEHFGVAVSTTGNTDAADFTTIQEWTMTAKSAKSVGTLRSSNAPRGGNRDQGTWYQYTVDLSAYSGQGYVAIRHFNCTDQFILNVDDIFIEQPGFEMPWVYVSNPTSPQALTNLEPETTYLVQVRANCGSENGYSQWLEGTFTTLPACMVPTGLVVSNIDKRSADLAWVSNGDEEAWQICVNGDEENLIYVTDTAYTLTDLLPDQTRYIVKVRAYCDEQFQSHWSSPVTFYTLIACPAPTNLFISDIANISAVANWTGEGDFELQYAEDVWKYYDNGVYATTMGAGGTFYWGMMLPAESLTAGEPLTNVALHTSYAGEATLNVYLGGDQPTGTPAATQTFTMAGDGDFMEITLDTPVAIDGTQNLWITFYQSGLTYAADGCTGPTDPNGRWVSLDGETWADIAGYGYDYTWMIRAAFGNNTQTEWVTIDNATSPQAITGLTPETDYLVRVKHVCGGIDGESVWVTTKFTTDIACPAPDALGATPYANSAVLSWEGISESYTVRYGYDVVADTLFSEDFAGGVIPADWTNDTVYAWTVVDGYIKSSNSGVPSSTSTISFTMTVSSDANFEFDAQCMGEGTSSIYDKCIFTLDGTEKFRKGKNGDQWDHYSYPITAGEHTFTWSYSKDSSVNPTGDYMAVDNIAINVVTRVWETTTATTNECLLTGLTPETDYYVQVQGDCGDYGTSEWSEMISFTTTNDLCPVPTNLDASNINGLSADLSWNGSPDVETFTVRYKAIEHVVGGISESFDASGVPAGWTRYSGLVDDVVAGTATLATTTSGWTTNTNALGTYNMKVNIFGSSVKYWLVTPEVTPTSGNFTFDLALTGYNSANPIANDTLQADDRFVVLVYADSTWTILREWNNSGSSYVYNTIATTGEAVSIDLSAYVGQAVKIAFYGESTNPTGMANTGGDNDLHIDNVVIGNPVTIPGTDWMYAESDATEITLTGLTFETPYQAQVMSACSADSIWSNTASFTTLDHQVQTIELAVATGGQASYTQISTSIEITLDELKAALVAAIAMPPATYIKIYTKTAYTTYNGTRWRGTLNALNPMEMFVVETDGTGGELVLTGTPINPADHPITILGNGQYTWFGFPFTSSMTLNNAFAGFAVSGDKVHGKDGSATFNGTRWRGSINALEPGKGYIYESASNSTDRPYVFPQ